MTITMCVSVYSSPYEEFYTFLSKLEVVINTAQVKNKLWILWGDWNIHFLQYSKKLLHLQDLLLRYNMVNIVKAPTRSFNNSTLLIDVMAIDKFYKEY
jgi:inhibitor of KinA sporulation pathway (predicted exonuclease)